MRSCLMSVFFFKSRAYSCKASLISLSRNGSSAVYEFLTLYNVFNNIGTRRITT